jgi:hypothetical protein
MQSNSESKVNATKKKPPKTHSVLLNGFAPIDAFFDDVYLTDKIPSDNDPTRLMAYQRYKDTVHPDKKGLNIVTTICLEELVDEKGVPTGVPIGFCPDTDWAISPNIGKKMAAAIYIDNPIHLQNSDRYDSFVSKSISANPSKYLDSKAHVDTLTLLDGDPDKIEKYVKTCQRPSVKRSEPKDGKPSTIRYQYELPLTNENPAFNVIVVDKYNQPMNYADLRGRYILGARYSKNFVYFQDKNYGWSNKWVFLKAGDVMPAIKRDPLARVTSFVNQSYESINDQIDKLCEPQESRKRKEYDGMPPLERANYESMHALEHFDE